MTHGERLPARRDWPFGGEEAQRANPAQLFRSSQQQPLLEGGKLWVMEELPGWGLRRRKIQLHREGLPDGRNLLVPLPASDALTEIGFENARSLPALLCPAGEWTPPYTTLWSLLAIPRAGFVSLNTQLPRNSLRGHGPNLVFSKKSSKPTLTQIAQAFCL